MTAQDLIDRHLAGDLDADEAARLAAWIAADPANAEEFVRACHAHTSLADLLAVPRPARAWSPRPWLAWAAAAVLMLTVTGWWLALGFGLGQHGDLRIIAVTGTVTLNQAAVVAGAAWPAGGRLETMAESSVDVAGPDGSTFAFASGSQMVWRQAGHGQRLELAGGSVQVTAATRPADAPLTIALPDLEARILGTRLRLDALPACSRVDLHQGRIEIVDFLGQSRLTMAAGQTAWAGSGIPLLVERAGFWSDPLPAGAIIAVPAMASYQAKQPLLAGQGFRRGPLLFDQPAEALRFPTSPGVAPVRKTIIAETGRRLLRLSPSGPQGKANLLLPIDGLPAVEIEVEARTTDTSQLGISLLGSLSPARNDALVADFRSRCGIDLSWLRFATRIQPGFAAIRFRFVRIGAVAGVGVWEGSGSIGEQPFHRDLLGPVPGLVFVMAQGGSIDLGRIRVWELLESPAPGG